MHTLAAKLIFAGAFDAIWVRLKIKKLSMLKYIVHSLFVGMIVGGFLFFLYCSYSLYCPYLIIGHVYLS